MSDYIDPYKDTKKTEEISQFSESGIYVRDDDQDWGSSGMNDVQIDSE